MEIKNYIGRNTKLDTAQEIIKNNGFKFLCRKEDTVFYSNEKGTILMLKQGKNNTINDFKVNMELYDECFNLIIKTKSRSEMQTKISPISLSVTWEYPYNTFEFIKEWEKYSVGRRNLSGLPFDIKDKTIIDKIY